MIDKAFLQKVGLDDTQVASVLGAVDKEHRLFSALVAANVSPKIIPRIVAQTPLHDVPDEDPATLAIRVAEEWRDFVMPKKRA